MQPKVKWSPAKKAFIAKFKHPHSGWKQKCVPVNISDEAEAQRWFDDWHSRLGHTGVEPLNNEVIAPSQAVPDHKEP